MRMSIRESINFPLIGGSSSSLQTPALVLDLAVFESIYKKWHCIVAILEFHSDLTRKVASVSRRRQLGSMLSSQTQVNAYLRIYLGDEFRLGIGIAYGPMVTGEVGFALKRQFTAIGDTVNVVAA